MAVSTGSTICASAVTASFCDPEEGGRVAIGLSDEEREALPRHPTDDYEAPLLKLP